MTRFALALVCLLFAACASIQADSEPAELRRFRYERGAMGTRFLVTLYAPNQVAAGRAAEAAFARLGEIETVATDYDRTSEARRLAQTAVGSPVSLSDDLARVVLAADAAVRESEGAFDPTVGVLTRHWRRAIRQKEWPAADVWSDASERVGWSRLVRIEESDGEVTVGLATDGMRLDFGGIAKGVGIDVLLETLQANGISHALVDGGGDVACLGVPPGEDAWQVEVRPYGERTRAIRLSLSRGAIATSGSVYRSAEFLGTPLPGASTERLGHVIDPRTCLPLPAPRAAVAMGPDATTADARATALLVAGEGAAALSSGVFFPSMGGDPCVGTGFPQDGAALTAPLPFSTIPAPSESASPE